MRKRVRVVYRDEARPARIVLCEAAMDRLQRRLGGCAAMRIEKATGYGRPVEFAALENAYGREIGMRAWGCWQDGDEICGDVIAFGICEGEICGLDEEEAEAVRRYLDGRERSADGYGDGQA